jgi:hypothetical protein
MRMWNIDPELMCRKHLLGEHVEMHMFLSAFLRNKKLDGYINTGLVEIHNIKKRHDCLAEEMIRRGYKHNSPIREEISVRKAGFVDNQRSYKELQLRCKECRLRMRT